MSLIKTHLHQQMMTSEQLDDLKSNYCEMIIDGMDMDTLIQLAYDLLMDSYADSTEAELKEEILDLYDEETLNDLMEEVK
jgi:hypothetical protein